jgi:acyl carrier protein
MDAADTVHAEILALLQRRGEAATRLADDDALTGTLGLDSAEVLALVPRLNARLGVDPFGGGEAITDVRTVGDLVRAYARASAGTGANALDAAAARAALRKARSGR